MDKNTIEYFNRYNDKITFTLVDENTIKMEGGKDSRLGWKTDDQLKNKQYEMVDPSGGPYISSGDEMRYFNEDWKDMFVDYITPENDYYLIKLKTNEINK